MVLKYKNRSNCWKHFIEIKENGRRVAGECKHCGKVYRADPDKNGTKNLNNHIPKCPKNPMNESKEVQTQLVFERDSNNEGEAKLKSWILDPHEARLAIVKHIVIDELPFRHVEKDGFKLMLSVLAPGLKVPSRTTIARDVYQLYVNERVLLKEHFVNACQRVCVTTDTWTSLQRLNYMCVTAHFVDNDWKLQKRIISFCTISSHKGDALALALTMCLDDWGLLDKLYTVTVDNAGSNSTACTALVEDFKRTQHHLFSNGNFLHVRCVAHILNLVVWDGLKVVGKSVSRIRAAVKFIRQSPSREARFYECAVAEKIDCKSSLCLDTPTRWNSTYKMLNVAHKYEHAFTKYAKIDPYFVIDFSKDKVDKIDRPPNARDWLQAKHLMIFLEAFYNATLHLSGTSYVTSNLLFFEIVAIYKMLQNLEDIDEVIDVQDIEIGADGEEDEVMVKNFKEMAYRMKLKFEKYYGKPEKLNTLVYIAPIFDPRYKLEGLDICVCDLFGVTSGESIMRKVKESVETLFDEYWQIYRPSQAQSGQCSAVLSEVENTTSMSGQTYAQQLQKRLKGAQRARGTELQKYLNEGLEEDSDVGDDLLGWWRVHGPRYPVLARMARDILAVPVSTVASESAFSTGGRHLDAFRTSLTPKMVQALICSQDWLKTSKMIDMEETLDELKSVEKDMTNLSVHDCVVDTADVLRL